MDATTKAKIEGLVNGNDVVLFMKGSRHFPQCGFSATVVQILDQLVKEYQTVNVLADPEVRDAIKAYSQWPTIPQLYVRGDFVGGCDIVRDMFQAGELQELLGVQDDTQTPTIVVTAAARQAIESARGTEVGELRLGVTPAFEYELAIDTPKPGDFEVDAGGVKVLVDRGSARRAGGVTIDYSDEQGGGFKIDNPNARG